MLKGMGENGYTSETLLMISIEPCSGGFSRFCSFVRGDSKAFFKSTDFKSLFYWRGARGQSILGIFLDHGSIFKVS